MSLKLLLIALAGVLLVEAAPAPSPYPPSYLHGPLLPAHSYSSVVHYPSYAYKYPYYSSLYPYYGYPYYKSYYGYGYGYGIPGSIYPIYY